MRPLIAGNWKMNGALDWLSKPESFNEELSESDRKSIDILICPPFPYISGLAEKAEKFGILTGGQDCHAEISGAHTGEVSAEMLKDCGASFVILGHSERRAAGESSQDIHKKALAAERAGLIPIICVGETLSQREDGLALKTVETQLEDSLPEDLQEFVIAYEPVWAIGTGKVASIFDIKQMHKHIRGQVGSRVRILYGGSVKPANAAEILATEHVNGALIGGASLKMEDFAAIAKTA